MASLDHTRMSRLQLLIEELKEKQGVSDRKCLEHAFSVTARLRREPFASGLSASDWDRLELTVAEQFRRDKGKQLLAAQGILEVAR